MTRRLERGTRLVVASHNPGKAWEIHQLLAPHGLDAVSAGDLGLTEPEETEPAFAGNARLKALAAAQASGLPALGDDSGLEVDALSGAPGIFSARWAGPARDFSIAMQRVHDELAARNAWPRPERPEHMDERSGLRSLPLAGTDIGSNKIKSAPPPRANFIAVMCLAWPDGETAFFEGRVFGHLVWPPRGGNGFGYDPMFLADGETQTFGEMAPARKYAMSHRTRAFKLFMESCLARQ